MIFTIGKKEIYEKYIDDDPDPRKAVGGSVWKFHKDAKAHLAASDDRDEFDVYAVDADWDKDTMQEEDGVAWRSLTRAAKLLKVRR